MGHDDLVRFPVTCPICRKQVIVEYRRPDVVGALLNDRPIRLYAPCCEKTWTAGYIEMQQIRGHFEATRLDDPSRTVPPKPRETRDD
ncbi:MAG: hypothetical protein ABSD02_19620 [Steroidobacteraceae bacterium]